MRIISSIMLTAITATGILLSGCHTTVKPQETTVIPPPPAANLKVVSQNVNNLKATINKKLGIKLYELFDETCCKTDLRGSMLAVTIKPGGDIPKHRLDCSLAVYVVHGGGNLQIAGHKYILSPDTAVYIPKNQDFHIVNDSRKKLQLLLLTEIKYPQARVTTKWLPPDGGKPEVPVTTLQAVSKATRQLEKDYPETGKDELKNLQTLTPSEGGKSK